MTLIFLFVEKQTTKNFDTLLTYKLVFLLIGPIQQICKSWGMGRNVLIKGVSRIPIVLKLQERWSKVSHAPREMVTAFPVTFFPF